MKVIGFLEPPAAIEEFQRSVSAVGDGYYLSSGCQRLTSKSNARPTRSSSCAAGLVLSCSVRKGPAPKETARPTPERPTRSEPKAPRKPTSKHSF